MGTKEWLSVSDVILATTDPFGLWHEVHGDPEEKDPPDPYLEFLRDSGEAWERKLATRRHPEHVDLSALEFDAAARETIDRLRPRAPALFQGALRDDDLGVVGRPDLLVHRGDRIQLEEYKLAGAAKTQHLRQAQIYAHLLARRQALPVEARVVTRLGEETTVTPDPASVDRDVHVAWAVVRAPQSPPPCYARESAWSRLQAREARRRQDVSLASSVGPATWELLHRAGVRTLDDLLAADPDALREIAGLGRVSKIRRSAEAIRSNRVLRLRAWTVESETPETELFLDLESSGDLFRDEPGTSRLYLTGLIPRPRGGTPAGYRSFLARTESEEARALGEFLEYLDGMRPEQYALYHWSAYERTTLRQACERHGCRARFEERVAPRLVDLMGRAQRAFVLPVPRWSIKLIAPYFGFGWRQREDEVGAMTSALIWLRQAERGGSGEDLDKVLTYNEDDCRAMIAVKDGLARLDLEVPFRRVEDT
jgi:uncharacterized protein